MARDFLEAVGVTDVGNVRHFNEDSIVVACAIGVMLLADGMGGHRAGEVASPLAANLVHTGTRACLTDPARPCTSLRYWLW